MRHIKTIVTLLLVAVGVTCIMALVMPTSIKVQRSIVINAKPDVVYAYLARLDNFNKWSVWSLSDSSIVNTIHGTDGKVGTYNTWQGHPEISGEGKMTITELLPGEKVKQHVSFYKPNKLEADSKFTLLEDNGTTKVTWVFEVATPRPRNIFNLFSSYEKQMGADFENGLRNLKAAIEKKTGAPKISYNISPYNFPGVAYAMFRQKNLAPDSIPGFIQTNLLSLGNRVSDEEMVRGNSAVLYFDDTYDQSSRDVAVALPVDGYDNVARDSVEIMDLPGSKAIMTEYSGDPGKVQPVLDAMNEYLSANGLKRKGPVVVEKLEGKLRVVVMVE